MCRDTAEVLLVTTAKSHKLSNSLTCWNWYLYFTAENGMITNWDLENSRARMMNTGWAMNTSMTCSLEVQVSSLHRFLSNLHEIVHLTGHCFVFRRELIKDWPDGLAWGKTLCHLRKFPACKWAGKKWSEWWFACIICHAGAPACAASDFSTRAVITALQNLPAPVPWDSWFGWLTNSPGSRDVSLGHLLHSHWVPKPAGDRIMCALLLTLLQGTGVPMCVCLRLKESFHEGAAKVWTSVRKQNPVLLLPWRVFQAAHKRQPPEQTPSTVSIIEFQSKLWKSSCKFPSWREVPAALLLALKAQRQKILVFSCLRSSFSQHPAQCRCCSLQAYISEYHA